MFGVTAHAAATTLAVFFLGLSAGAFLWGRRGGQSSNPLRLYAWLELGIAASALCYFGILDFYHAIYTPLISSIGHRPGVLLGVKFLLAVGILFLPSLFMGGTLPVMGQFLVRRADELGRKASLLYAINTSGAATGALLAGFWLPRVLGFRNSYFVAVGLNVLIAGVAWFWSRSAQPRNRPIEPPQEFEKHETDTPLSVRPAFIWMAAFVSGFAALALEVLWTRMYAQVLENSVYTFAIILVVFLSSLAVGSVVASWLCRLAVPPPSVLCVLLTVAGLLVSLTPTWFNRQTSGLESLGGELGWAAYAASNFQQVAMVLLLPGIALGTVFPYLMKISEQRATSAATTIGRLVSVNTLAAILGSLASGFLLLELVGLWTSIRLIAMLYLVTAIVVLPVGIRQHWVLRTAAAVAMLFVGAGLLPSKTPAISFADADEPILQVYEGSHATVAVIGPKERMRIKINSSYAFGNTDAPTMLLHRMESWIPLCLHADPQEVFFLGLGTGMTAAGALDCPVRSVTICELVPEVVQASREHFQPFLNGLLEDPRVNVLSEDGRTYLRGARQRYDVIIAELFLPWKAGAGSLYTKEHFQTVQSRLQPKGLFAQWMPLAQMSEQEFGIVARTMLEVFPQVTVWRNGLSRSSPGLALVGQNEAAPLDNDVFRANIRRLTDKVAADHDMWFAEHPHVMFAGNLTLAGVEFEKYPINSDDWPLIEYLAPITLRKVWTGEARMLEDFELVRLYEGFLRSVDPRDDPYLAQLSDGEIGYVRAGLLLEELTACLKKNQVEKAGQLSQQVQQLLNGSKVR